MNNYNEQYNSLYQIMHDDDNYLDFDIITKEEAKKTFDDKHTYINNNLLITNEINEFESAPYAITLSETRFDSIPLNIGSLKSCEGFDADGSNISYIPNSFCDLSKLTILYLSGNNIDELPLSFGNLSMLTVADLSDNGITQLPNTFGNLLNLETLNLSDNYIITLPESFGQLKSLDKLDIRDNIINKLPNSIGNLSNLKTLLLQFNQLDTLPNTIENLTNLEILNIEHNKFSNLPNSITKLTNLSCLYANNNDITKLPFWFGKLENLLCLYLNHNKLTELSPSFNNLSNLLEIGLDHNEFSEFPSEIPCSIESISLMNNNILNMNVEWKFYYDLKFINLSNNPLTQLGNDFVKLKKLGCLNLSHCNFNVIPDSIYELENLIQIDLHCNNINEISTEIENLSKLEKIHISSNHIIHIPSEIGNCPEIEYIDVRNNPIEYIPETLINITLYDDMPHLDDLPLVEPAPNDNILVQDNHVYFNPESVHNTYIQGCIKTSIQNIMKDEQNISIPNIRSQIIHDNILTQEVKELIIEYSISNEVQQYLNNITYTILLQAVWQRIQKHEESTEIKKILIQEIIEGKDKCFTGKLAQLVNSLVGYYDDVQINISQNEQINLIILNIRNKLIEENDEIDNEQWQTLVTQELIERGYSESITNIWIKAIQEMI